MDIKEFAYELYKAKWIGSHCNLQIMEETIIDAFEDGISVQDYIREYGFKGSNECFVCYEEFIDNEYQDEDIMTEIFGGEEKYLDLWEKDLSEEDDEDDMDFDDAMDILNDLELDDTAYDYYREALEGIHYNDQASHETHGYKSLSDVIEDARRCEEDLLDEEDE